MPATDRQKRISVALITCNGEQFLAELLGSLVRQTLPPWEVVVCDDASTDRTPEILRDYSGKLPMKLICNEQRLGVNRNFEKAIEQCSGDYFALCDQDDVWHADKLEKLFSAIQEGEALQPVLVRSNSWLMNESMNCCYGPVFRKRQGQGLNKRFFYPAAQGAGMMFNGRLKELILPFPDQINAYDFYIAMVAELTGRSMYLPEPLMKYRLHTGNAVGVSARPDVVSRMVKLLRGGFTLYVPGAFNTLSTILACGRFAVGDRLRREAAGILSLNHPGVAKMAKIALLFTGQMARPADRIVLAVKICFHKFTG